MEATAGREELETGIREGEIEDIPFVLSSWLRHGKHSSPFARSMRSSVYFLHHHDLIESLLRDGASVLIAHLEDDPSVILSYLCFEPGEIPIIHFAFCKPAFRRIGLFRKLLQAAQIDPSKDFFITHFTDTCFSLAKKWPAMTYDPYLFLSRGH